jgi:hypothetical protein
VTTTRPLRIVLGACGLLIALAWGFTLVQPPPGASLGLDGSWRVALTLAAQQHLRFGEQIVFTFGPLGYALQGIPDPGLAVATVLVQGLLAAATVAGIWTLLAGGGSAPAKLAFAASVAAFASIVLVDYVAAIAALALVAGAARHPRTALFAGSALGVIALLGMLSKYTLGIDALAAGTAAWAVDALRGPKRRRRIALLGAAACWGLTALGMFAAFAFSPAGLAAYLRGAAEISNGYSGAMALPGPASQVVLAALIGAAILGAAILLARERRAGVAAAAAIVLFLAWKHGFVRQDGHVIYYFGTAPAVAAVLAIALRRKTARAFALTTTALALGAFVWIHLQIWHAPPRLFDPERATRGLAFLRDPVGVVAERASGAVAALAPDRLPAATVASLRAGSVDVLPWETAIVPANALRWAPLPVFQTYSAYTPRLDALDRDALAANGAAHVLYRYVAFDERAPFGDAPATLAELACRYALETPNVTTAANEPYLLLRRDARAHCDDESAGSVDARVNEPIAVPPAGAPNAFVVASVAVRPSLATRAATALWRAPRLDVVVRFDDATEQRYRVVAATLGDGMIVSAFPRDGDEAARFFAGRAVRAVRTIAFVARPGAYALGRVTFTRRLRRV